jgi:hypothetical protein
VWFLHIEFGVCTQKWNGGFARGGCDFDTISTFLTITSVNLTSTKLVLTQPKLLNHAECYSDTSECDFDTLVVVLTGMRLISTQKVRLQHL